MAALIRRRSGFEWRRWWVTVSTVASVVVLVAVVIVAAVHWPARFGGSHTVVRVSGQSMEPGLQTGDVVVVRSQGAYDLGDVIVYPGRDDSGVIRGHVIHRIVDGDALQGYVTRGDSLTTDDPWRPRPADIEGRVVRVLERGSVAGSLVSVFTQPHGLAAIAAGLAFLGVWRASARSAKRTEGRVAAGAASEALDGTLDGAVQGAPMPSSLVTELAALVRVLEAAADQAVAAADALERDVHFGHGPRSR